MVFFWIILYGLVHSVFEVVSGLYTCPWLLSLSMSVYTALLILWIVRTDRNASMGLFFSRVASEEAIWLFPLTVLPFSNLFLTDVLILPGHSVLLTLCTCTAEELFFRGFLFSCLRKHIGHWSAGVVSTIFALFHLANLISGWPPGYVAVQVLVAFSVSLYYCLIRFHWGSLYPCVIAHFLTNITAGELLTDLQSDAYLIWMMVSVSYLVCSLFLFRKISVNNGG